MEDILDFNDQHSAQELPAEISERIIFKDDDWYFDDREYVTNSMMGELEKSPSHLHMYLNRQKEDKKHDIEGKAFHTSILEPNEFDKRFYVFDDAKVLEEIGGKKPRGTNKYKEWKELELVKAEGKMVLNGDKYEDLMRMRDKVLSIQEIRNLLSITSKEVIMKDTYDGVKRKCKFDAIRHRDFFFDLKSTKDPSGKFRHAFFRYNYDRQTAWYKDIGQVTNGFVICVEKTYPYSVAILEITDDTFERGRDKYRPLIKQYEEYFLKGKIKDFSTHYQRGFI